MKEVAVINFMQEPWRGGEKNLTNFFSYSGGTLADSWGGVLLQSYPSLEKGHLEMKSCPKECCCRNVSLWVICSARKCRPWSEHGVKRAQERVKFSLREVQGAALNCMKDSRNRRCARGRYSAKYRRAAYRNGAARLTLAGQPEHISQGCQRPLCSQFALNPEQLEA